MARFFVKDHCFTQRAALCHQHGPAHLLFGQGGVDNGAGVDGVDKVQHCDLARAQIHRHLRTHAAQRPIPGGVALARFRVMVLDALGNEVSLAHYRFGECRAIRIADAGGEFAPADGAVLIAHLARLGAHLFDGYAEHLSPFLSQLALEILRRQDRGVAGAPGGMAGYGLPVVRGGQRIYTILEMYLFKGQAQRFRADLRQRRVQALAHIHSAGTHANGSV